MQYYTSQYIDKIGNDNIYARLIMKNINEDKKCYVKLYLSGHENMRYACNLIIIVHFNHRQWVCMGTEFVFKDR